MNYDKQKYKVYTWKNGLMLHWIINPGLAINELILGQRIPKISLLDKTSEKPLHERSYTPCPHCETLHDNRTWSQHNNTGFKNWFGLYCVNCGGIIPCLMNITSYLVLLITFPIWGWFKDALKKKWLVKQPKRFEDLNFETLHNPYSRKNWIITGLGWGGMMFVMITFVLPYFGGDEITIKNILIAIPIWAIAGLLFGYSMKRFMNQKGEKSN